MAESDKGGSDRFRQAAPLAAAALAVTAAIAGATLLTDTEAPATPPSDAQVISAAAAPAEAPQQAPQTGSAVPGLAFEQAPAAGGGGQTDMEIVVKFKDDGKVKDIVDTFWRDQSSGREKFEAFKARRPEFADLTLDRVTYSNELVLVQEGGPPPEQKLPAMRAMAARLNDAADVSYAEPNMTAQPGGQ
jgi:hypothetical protein